MSGLRKFYSSSVYQSKPSAALNQNELFIFGNGAFKTTWGFKQRYALSVGFLDFSVQYTVEVLLVILYWCASTLAQYTGPVHWSSKPVL